MICVKNCARKAVMKSQEKILMIALMEQLAKKLPKMKATLKNEKDKSKGKNKY